MTEYPNKKGRNFRSEKIGGKNLWLTKLLTLAFPVAHVLKIVPLRRSLKEIRNTLSTPTLASLAEHARKFVPSERPKRNNQHRNCSAVPSISGTAVFGKLSARDASLFYVMELEKDERLEDLMIDGLKIVQNNKLYRFTSDAVLLSKFAPKVKGKVADFCAGSGIVGIHYYALNKGVTVDEYELQKPLADLCKKTIEYDSLDGIVNCYNMAIQDIPADKDGQYSLILCNPPYKKANSGEKSKDDHIALCRHEIAVTLSEIFEISAKKLKHSGRLCICQMVERFTEIITGMRQNGLEPCKIAFVTSGKERKPYLVLVEGAKGVKPQLKVLPSIDNGV